MSYVTASQIRERVHVSTSTLRNWADSGELDCIRLPGGKRLYNSDQLQSKFFHRPIAIAEEKAKIIYARVSSQHQKPDLERQIQDLQEAYKGYEVIKDVASGLNWKRPGLCALLERCYKGTVSEVVVAYKDRLCRFGLELLEWIFAKYQVRLVVHNKMETPPDPSRELAEDLLAVANYFVAKNNGQRAAEKKRKRKEAKQGPEEGLRDDKRRRVVTDLQMPEA